MLFRVKPSSQPKFRIGYKFFWKDGHKRRKRIRYENEAGPPKSKLQIADGTFYHNGQKLHAGDIVESNTNLESAFPNRFEFIDENETFED